MFVHFMLLGIKFVNMRMYMNFTLKHCNIKTRKREIRTICSKILLSFTNVHLYFCKTSTVMKIYRVLFERNCLKKLCYKLIKDELLDFY